VKRNEEEDGRRQHRLDLLFDLLDHPPHSISRSVAKELKECVVFIG
jgi:hypothetical protein